LNSEKYDIRYKVLNNEFITLPKYFFGFIYVLPNGISRKGSKIITVKIIPRT